MIYTTIRILFTCYHHRWIINNVGHENDDESINFINNYRQNYDIEKCKRKESQIHQYIKHIYCLWVTQEEACM